MSYSYLAFKFFKGLAPSMVTPANKMLPTNIGRTPMITPKFDTMTPLTRTLHRQARPNETLVSLSGSPVMATATVKKAGRGKVGNDFVLRS